MIKAKVEFIKFKKCYDDLWNRNVVFFIKVATSKNRESSARSDRYQQGRTRETLGLTFGTNQETIADDVYWDRYCALTRKESF